MITFHSLDVGHAILKLQAACLQNYYLQKTTGKQIVLNLGFSYCINEVRGGGTACHLARGALKKLGQKLKRGPQIEPYRHSYSINGLLFIIIIRFRSKKRIGSNLGAPF